MIDPAGPFAISIKSIVCLTQLAMMASATLPDMAHLAQCWTNQNRSRGYSAQDRKATFVIHNNAQSTS